MVKGGISDNTEVPPGHPTYPFFSHLSRSRERPQFLPDRT
jgi:hypothetical protein